MSELRSPYLELLKNRINLQQIPFSERGSRLLLFQNDHQLSIRLAERWFKIEQQLNGYRERPPIIDEWCLTDENGTPLDSTSRRIRTASIAIPHAAHSPSRLSIVKHCW